MSPIPTPSENKARRSMKGLLLPWLIHSAFVIPHSAFAAELPTAPILRIEASAHTDTVKSVDMDASGKTALTVSNDKTARLWELSTGRLLRVLRPPIGLSEQGMLYAGALSPDGSLAAVGGYMESTSEETICLFDTKSGQMLRRLEGLSGVTFEVAFSAQGRRLAGVGSGWGLRVWDVASGREVARDADSGKLQANTVHWHGENRLVTTWGDGSLRLYELKDDKLQCIAKTVAREGRYPATARFSPDGQRIATGFSGTPAIVAVLSAKDLSFLYAPATSDIPAADLRNVAWTGDGTTLAAGAEWNRDGSRLVRLWPQAGQGQPQDYPVAKDSIADLSPGPGKSVLFSSFDSSWGLLGKLRPSSASTSAQTLSPTPRADPRDMGEAFRLSEDGTTVVFSYDPFGKSPALFSVTSRELIQDGETLTRRLASQAGSLKPPRQEGLPVTDWKYTTQPKLAGKPLTALMNAETSRSLAINGAADAFLLGTQWSLRHFNAQGQQDWDIGSTAIVWAANFADKDRLAVVAGSDGVIRWHRADNGRELLAFFPHTDRRRWVAWATEYEIEKVATLGAYLELWEGKVQFDDVPSASAAAVAGVQPGDHLVAIGQLRPRDVDEAIAMIRKHAPGETLNILVSRKGQQLELTPRLQEMEQNKGIKAVYYDCAPGAEDLIGWHVNRGMDKEADFFPAAKFRDQFYRPDIIQLVLSSRDVAAAVAQANAAAGVRVQSTVSISHVLLQMAPPVVEMTVGGPTRTLELPEDATETTLTYRVRGGSTPVSQMRVLVDSRPVEASAPIPAGEKEEARVTVPLPGRDCVVALLAGNAHAFSEPALVNIRRKAATAPSTPALPKKGILYLLAVGVSQLKNQAALTDLQKLEYADDDATAFYHALATQTKLYSKVESRVLTDDKATAGDILDALDWLKGVTTPEDTTLILLAGHGESDAQGRYTFCAHDYDRSRRLRTGVGFEDIKLALGATKGEVVLFLDACSAGSSLGAGSKVDVSGLVNQLSDSDSNIVVFASSDGRTPSLESDDLKQGLFTHCVKEGLSGKADLLRNGRITLSALQTYVDDAVRTLSEGQQIPVINIPKMVPNLTLGLTP